MKNNKILIFISALTGFMWLLLGISCEKTELTRSMDSDGHISLLIDSIMIDDSVKIDDESGISFEMESDTLKEEIEEVHFHAKEWEVEGLNVDL